MHMKASGAVSGRGESHVCQEEVTAVTVTSFAVSLPSRIKIPLKKKKEKKAFKIAFLETNLLNISSFYVPELAHSQPLLSAGLGERLVSALQNQASEKRVWFHRQHPVGRRRPRSRHLSAPGRQISPWEGVPSKR